MLAYSTEESLDTDSVATTVCLSPEQHNIEILENRKLWEKKPLLHKVYSQFYREIARQLKPDVPGLIVELGSGMGNVKEYIPQCITTDIFPNPWLDRVENAYRLSFDKGEVGNLILFDVWHHLQYPGTALNEFSRILAPGGRVILFEPAMGLIGRFVFGHFHHEPLGLDDEIQWNAPDGFSGDAAYYAAQGNASRVFRSAAFKDAALHVANCGYQAVFLASHTCERGVPRPAVVSGKIVALPQPVRRGVSQASLACVTHVGGTGKEDPSGT